VVTALYRRYRPETFAEMIGQSQVTEPLMTALRANRVNHAYLFSGPRGCGKTTSARILARCLNCAEGPTDTPCGVCPSCVELSRDGSGSLDVVEIDAASHNGVDDARDIRERAIFAPARDRYKIFILDEAHMVTPQGFNALLKIVEEPPEHVKFIFATTEPEKVIGTIRSRTHHYPFRLVPPAQMLEYVQQLCVSEGVKVAPGVLPLVVRGGGGSPRDTLSLLDQLMAGSDGASVEYERAVALLGYTHAALLDEAVDAIAARDSGAAFDAVDRVIQTGQDPRRFVEDLLERMRDLIIVAATSAEGAAAVLRGIPQEEIDRMAVQAGKFGSAELSRTADIINAALTEMTGATSPKLHLELMVARALIPASDDSTRGALARVERLERRVGVDTRVVEAPADPSTSTNSVPVAAPGHGAPSIATRRDDGAAPAPVPVVAEAEGGPTNFEVEAGGPSLVGVQTAQAAGSAAGVNSAATSAAPARPIGPVRLQQVKDAWPEILEAVKTAKLNAWLVVFTARVLELRDDDVLIMSFPSETDVASFKEQQAPGQGVSEYLRAAIVDVLGIRVKFVAKAETAPAAPALAQPEVGITSALPSSAPTHSADAGAGTSAPSGSPSNHSLSNSSPSNYAASTPLGQNPSLQANSRTAFDTPSGVPAPHPRGGATRPQRGSGGAPPVERTVSATSGSTEVVEPPPAGTTALTTGWATVAIPGAAADMVVAPFDEEPPPFDDDIPPEMDAPESESGWSTAPTQGIPAPAETTTSATVRGTDAPTITASASKPEGSDALRAQAPAAKARATQAPATRAPSFEDKQRYGEAVVREILGATFLEEQPHVPAQRSRGD
jgi:DNA polymerase-3 subunit gamma/tau